MKILLINVDSKLPNIALKKIELWHNLNGDEVIWDIPMLLGQIDKAYASCIFTKNKHIVENYKGLYPDIIAGGTGYDLTIKLPPEIESMKPKINYGFTTRGCIRKCPFCFVPLAEGNLHPVGDIYDFWDRKANSITLLDNNILGLPEHFRKICGQLAYEKLSVDFNQGLDIRLVTDEVCELLKSIVIKSELRFAFDHPSLGTIIMEKVELLNKHKVRSRYFFYVLVGYDTTFEQDLHRLNIIKELGCRAYIMRHENTPKEKRYIRLAEWVNQMWTFDSMSFKDFCKIRG